MTVGDIMTKKVVTVTMDDTLATVQKLFERFQFHHVVVKQDSKVVGVISDRDLFKSISPFVGKLMERSQDVDTLKRRAHQIMSRKLIVAHESMAVEEAAQLLLDERVSCLPVLDERRRLRGIVTWKDLLTAALLAHAPSVSPPETPESA